MKKLKAAFGSKSTNDGAGRQGDGPGAAPQQPEPEPRSGSSGQKLRARALAGQISTSIPIPPQVAGISSLLGTNSSRAAHSPRTTSTTSNHSNAPRPPVPSLTGLSRSLLSATESVQRKVATTGPAEGYSGAPRTAAVQQTQPGGGQNVNISQAVSIPGDQTVSEATAAFLALRLANQSAFPGTITQAVPSEESDQKTAVFCKWCDRCKEGMFCFQILE
jgi:hypothetical protein